MGNLDQCLTELCASLNRACEIFSEAVIYPTHADGGTTIGVRLREELIPVLASPAKKYIRAFCRAKGWQMKTFRSPGKLTIHFELAVDDPKTRRAGKGTGRQSQPGQ